MKKYCKILNEETGLVQIGVGCPDSYYIEIGMEKRNVKQSDLDGEWYLEEKCPVKPKPTPKERETNFKSKFFYIQGYGWYRKQPKGYQSAVESMNVAYNIANENNGISAGLIIFYQQPDFTIEEQCTEEWLVEHQIIQGAMTKAEFMTLYVAFITAWNREEHE